MPLKYEIIESKKLIYVTGEKCAIVASTDFGFALARVHAALSEASNIDTSVFRDLNEALTWSGVELDDDELING